MRATPREHPVRRAADGALASGRGLTAREVAGLGLPDELAKRLRTVSEQAAETKSTGAYGEARRLLAEGVDEVFAGLSEDQQDVSYLDPVPEPFDPEALADRIRQ